MARDARYVRAVYQSDSNKLGEVNAQIVIHPPDYPYVAHDFYGVFDAVQDNDLTQTPLGKEHLGIQFVDRKDPGGDSIKYLCHSVLDNPPGDSGVFGWISEENGRTVTVFIAYEHLSELPWALIDRYLESYPSEIAKDDPRAASWYADDINKWSQLLQTRGGEDSILRMASVQLRRYDRSAFGLSQLWAKRKDPVALSAGVEAAVIRMNEWSQARQQPKSQAPQP